MALYVATGLVGAMVDFLFFALALSLGAPVVPSQWFGATAGALHNSLIHHFVVFSHDRKLKHTAVPNTLLSIVTIALSGPLLPIVGYAVGDIWMGKVLLLALTAVSTYAIRKFVIFRRMRPVSSTPPTNPSF